MSKSNGIGSSNQSIDRLPPHSSEAEMAVLGCIFLGPDVAIPACVTKIGQDLDAFYDLRHKMIYTAAVEMFDLGFPIDLITIGDWLKAKNQLEEVGGVSFLITLPDTAPSASNIDYYLDILLEKFRSRSLIRITSAVVGAVYENERDTDTLIEDTAQQLLEMSTTSVVIEEELMPPMVHRALDQIEQWHQHQGVITGIDTGFTDLDKLTTGFHPGEMIVIAGRPGFGKTSLAMNIVDHTAVERNMSVGVFSLEMTRDALVMRLLCSRARVHVRNIMDGFLAERDFPKLTGAAGRLIHAPIHINDRSGLSIIGLRTRARKMKQQHDIQLLVVDYLQLLSAERNRNDNRQNEVTLISNGLKCLAKDLGIPVICLSQLSRGIEKEARRKPKLSDLRESGSIEQDADFVGILYKSVNEQQDEEDHQDATAIDLEVCKQRNGPTGTIHLTFLRAYTRFESAARVSSDDTDSTQYSPPYADQEPTVEQGQML